MFNQVNEPECELVKQIYGEWMCEKYVCLSVWESVQASALYLIIHVQCVYVDQIPAILCPICICISFLNISNQYV